MSTETTIASPLTQQLLTDLDVRLEDTDAANYRFAQETKMRFLSEAQVEVANMLNNAYLKELQTVEASRSIKDGYIQLSLLNGGAGPFKGAAGVEDVFVTTEGNGGKYALWTDLKELKDLVENTFKKYDDDNPYVLIYGDKLYVLVDTYEYTASEEEIDESELYTDDIDNVLGGITVERGATVDVYYLVRPVDITAEVPPTLNQSLFPILLDWAEAKGWKIDNNPNRSSMARQSAIDQINVLNERMK